MEVKVTIRTITIREDATNEEFTVRTLRSAKDIAGEVEESERDAMVSKLGEAVSEALSK